MRKILCLPLCVIAVAAFYVVLALSEALVSGVVSAIFVEGLFTRGLTYTIYGVGGIIAAAIGYEPLKIVDPPSRALRVAACVIFVVLGVVFVVVVASDYGAGGAWAWPTRVFGVLLGLGALAFVNETGENAAKTAAEPSPTASSQAEPGPPSPPPKA